MKDRLEAFGRLLTIMDELREQCPWDKKQTIDSLRHLSIEEVYELSDAIINQDYAEIQKELGDVLLHIVFYARIASEENHFDITDVINSLCEKLITRHPHIYGDVKAETDEQVKQNWEQIKLREGGGKKRLLSGVPTSMPSLVKAWRMQEKAAQVGFDWEKKEQVWDKVKEEMLEFEQSTSTEERLDEFGDLLFALVNYARFEDINPDDALERTNAKFKRRVEFIEEEALKQGRSMKDMTLVEMEEIWNKAKKQENI